MARHARTATGVPEASPDTGTERLTRETAEAPFALVPRRRPRGRAAPLLTSAGTALGQPDRPWEFLCLAEIANFSALRRHLGRARADQLVRDMCRLIEAALPRVRATVVGRTIVEIAQGGEPREELDMLVGALTSLFEAPLDIDGEPHRLEMLFAAVAGPIAATEEVRLAEEAESALEQARSERRSVIRDLSVGTPAFDRLTLTRELLPALARGEMFVQYQPKVNVRQQRVCSIEALVRWQHPERGLILPGDFITLAEEARVIGPLTLWTLERLIHDQRRLAGFGHDLTIFLNISGQLLGDEAFIDEACRRVRTSGAKIGFEITETAVIQDPQTAIRHLQAVAQVGIPIAIDDYGAGLSSLAYLKQLPATELKIDKLFVLNLTSSNRDPLIVRSTIDLAHALDMEVTAEGVETAAALALLTVMGCDLVQGYLVSRPIGFEALVVFLEEASTKGLGGAAPMLNRPASFWKRA